jgi:hypothetical protein
MTHLFTRGVDRGPQLRTAASGRRDAPGNARLEEHMGPGTTRAVP